MHNIYLDNASTTKTYTEVLESFTKASIDYFANPASTHKLGLLSDELLTKARKQIAKYFQVKDNEVIFTSGATEGNNLAIKGVMYQNSSWGKKAITTKGEHPSVLKVFEELEQEGFSVTYLDYDKEGKLDLEQLKNSLDDKTSLVSIMAINNETGYIFPIEECYKITKRYSKAVFHTDATQAVGKEPIFFPYDLLSFSGHKIGGIKGSGALIKKSGVTLKSQILGGGQEFNLRSGTSSLPLDVSLATAIRLSFNSLESRRNNVLKIRDYLYSSLSEIEEVEIISPKNSSPFIFSFALKEHKGSVVMEALSNRGIYVSTRSACSSREKGYSYVIKNAGYEDIIASNAIRFSFTGNEDLEDIKIFVNELKDCLQILKKER